MKKRKEFSMRLDNSGNTLNLHAKNFKRFEDCAILVPWDIRVMTIPMRKFAFVQRFCSKFFTNLNEEVKIVVDGDQQISFLD
uniref:Uncharacterized protein n=1 Tax=Romanomermis culicivorax TaxID=13658 RepID=A0A915JF64_ROMCU